MSSREATKGKTGEEGRTNLLKAYTFQIISSLSLVLMQLNVKQLSHYFSPFLVLGVRGSLLSLTNLGFIYKAGLDFNIRNMGSIF